MPRALATITNSRFAFGGVSTWIERITETLPVSGWNVTTVTHALDAKHLAGWKEQHPGMVVKPILGKFVHQNDIEPFLEAYLDTEKPDVVLINGAYWMIPAIQRRKARGERTRIIGICHADDAFYYSGLGWNRDCLDHVIGVSKSCYEKLLELGFPSERTSLLPYGVPCSATVPSRDHSGELRLVYVGRLVQWQKRILDFVPLIEQLTARGINYRLDFYGAGDEEGLLRERVAAIDPERRVHFHGWVMASQVSTVVWGEADVFLQMSAYEGLSNSMVEAMANGVVPIVSRVASGVGDVIREGDTGFTFPIGDVATCVQLIESLERDRARLAQMSRNGWGLARKEFSLEQHAQRLALILDSTRESPAMTAPGRYMGMTSRSFARLLPGWTLVASRRLLKRGNPDNEGFTTYP